MLKSNLMDLPWQVPFQARGEIVGRSGINWTAEFPRFTADLTGDGKTDLWLRNRWRMGVAQRRQGKFLDAKFCRQR
jgi:hypothetical protein